MYFYKCIFWPWGKIFLYLMVVCQPMHWMYVFSDRLTMVTIWWWGGGGREALSYSLSIEPLAASRILLASPLSLLTGRRWADKLKRGTKGKVWIHFKRGDLNFKDNHNLYSPFEFSLYYPFVQFRYFWRLRGGRRKRVSSPHNRPIPWNLHRKCLGLRKD